MDALLREYLAILIFLSKRAGVALDRIVVILGALMILMTLYVAVVSAPPLGEALKNTVAYQRKIQSQAVAQQQQQANPGFAIGGAPAPFDPLPPSNPNSGVPMFTPLPLE